MATARSKENMKQTVGVIGLGAMGKAIATNLLKSGFHTTVWNRSPESVSELASVGAVGAKNIREAPDGQGLGLEDWSVALANVSRTRSATVAA
jgi:glutamyl-tRNA reductase